MNPAIKKFLIFSLQDSQYALDLTHVAEINDTPQLWPVPLVHGHCRGVLNFHGDIVLAINLGYFFGGVENSVQGKIIVLHRDVAALALLVDSVIRIVSEDEVTCVPPSGNALITAVFTLAGSEVMQLDLDAVVRATENSMSKKQRVSPFV
ncbi:MAG: chemotaxis protein CheW [Desulfuromonadaceae bacterium]|nr:chemotaxis protein CheW [Desulfuromonadaceae bacterium]MDD5106515.1 chemotaxis protein CheW [Desulfuromonadaceae bacterium]